ncbi:hypothetical protein OTU49_008353 [Cherax quadricarinatus]|uniref:Uncharacterized protein n=1 Tax=Cherax quadricarinatus TaxID=27406 RepID=A0AAW0WFR4_CHEQU
MSHKLGATIGRLCVRSSRQATNVIQTRVPAMRLSTQPAKAYGEVPEVLQQKMKLFQAPNGLPVHIKGGTVDKILFGITATVCFLGLIECLRVFYVLSYPQKK